MKYKVGDRVKMWKSENDFGHNSFLKQFNYILTIKNIDYAGDYEMEEDTSFMYTEGSIECLEENCKKFDPIESRFEILDL